MNRVLTLLLFIVSLNLHANQDDKVFLDSNFQPIEGVKGAMYYRTVSLNTDSLFYSEVYYLNDSPQMKGHYLDESLTVLHGYCKYFYKTGKLESEGNYNHGIREGFWKRYTLFGEEKPERYYPKVSDDSNVRISKLASFQGGHSALADFLEENTQFPEEAKLLEIHSGKVSVNIKVNELGQITGFDILSSTSRYFTKEAKRIIAIMPDWSPALRHGRAISSSFIVTIPFSYSPPPVQTIQTTQTTEGSVLEN